METKVQRYKLPAELPIYYGSQTGTASDFANILAQEVIQYGAEPKVIDLVDFNLDEFVKEELSVFIVATYGSGGPTTNAVKFHKWLKSEEAKEDLLKGKKFAVFGCGDSGYKKFNKMAKDVDELLTIRGAKKICETGLGDASEDIEVDFIKWKEIFWSSLEHSPSKKENVEAIFDTKAIESFDFSTIEFDLTAKQYLEASNFIRER